MNGNGFQPPDVLDSARANSCGEFGHVWAEVNGLCGPESRYGRITVCVMCHRETNSKPDFWEVKT